MKTIKILKNRDRKTIAGNTLLEKLKSYNYYLFAGTFFFLASVISCEKNVDSDKDFIAEITGSYEGTLTYSFSADNNTSAAYANVESINDSQIEIHCYGEAFDTIVILDVYEHYDSALVCLTGDEFESEYGHTNGHMQHMMHDNETDWIHHVEDEHDEGDEHFGGFDMQNHTFT
jgi:hypothetical protein